jgi:hypothetical protein
MNSITEDRVIHQVGESGERAIQARRGALHPSVKISRTFSGVTARIRAFPAITLELSNTSPVWKEFHPERGAFWRDRLRGMAQSPRLAGCFHSWTSIAWPIAPEKTPVTRAAKTRGAANSGRSRLSAGSRGREGSPLARSSRPYCWLWAGLPNAAYFSRHRECWAICGADPLVCAGPPGPALLSKYELRRADEVSAAVPGYCPRINAGVRLCEKYVALGKIARRKAAGPQLNRQARRAKQHSPRRDSRGAP